MGVVKQSIFIGLFACAAIGLFAQEFEQPEILPSSINSDGDDLTPFLLPDGKTIFFTRSQSSTNSGGTFGGSDIWTSELLESGWRRATNDNIPFNTTANEAVIGVSRAGTTVYFVRTRAGQKIKGIFKSTRNKGVWSEGVLEVVPGIESASTVGFFMHPDEDVLLMSMEISNGMGKQDLYYSLKGTDGTWSKPRSMGVVVNTSGSEISPFLSRDKNQLYFSSDGHEGVGGFDLYVCDRLQQSWDTWSAARNLGPTINTKGFEAYFSIAEDSTVFYASAPEGKSCNLLVAKFKKQEKILAADTKKYIDEEIRSIAGRELVSYIGFEKSSAELNKANLDGIGQIADAIRYLSAVKVYLIGYEARDNSQFELTQKRLFTILDYLKAKGISGDRIAFGFELTEDTTVTERVRIRFYRQ